MTTPRVLTVLGACTLVGFICLTSACKGESKAAASESAGAAASAANAANAAKKLGIRPDGDQEVKPDLAMVSSDELKKVYTYIDDHVDEHVENLQKWIRQPSISNTGEGIQESAEMVKGFFDQLGCQESK